MWEPQVPTPSEKEPRGCEYARHGGYGAEFIAKGTPVWKFQEGFDVLISEDEFSRLSIPAQEQVLHYCYFNSTISRYVLCSDDARFFNHSDEANVNSDSDDSHIDTATRDIQAGEELTQDYKIFDGNFHFKKITNPV
jgi:hypothetical protein